MPKQKKDPSSFAEPRTNTQKDLEYRQRLSDHFEKSSGTTYEKLWSFSRFAPRQRMTMLLSKYEIMKQLLEVQGSIIEVGVHFGAGLFEWAQFCEILEPRNYQRKIYGFDNFAGFESISEKDQHVSKSVHLKSGGLKADVYSDLKENIEIFDLTRNLGHIEKISLLKGNALKTIPKFVADNPQLVVSLLYLDVDLYEPTKAALEHFLPRMPKGSIIVFDELNCEKFPGETVAVHELIGISNLTIKRSPFDTWMSYAILGQ
jgi:hypothetical protein